MPLQCSPVGADERVVRPAFVCAVVLLALWLPTVGAGQHEFGPPNPEFTACRTSTKLVINFRFASFPSGRNVRPWLLLASAKSAGTRYAPLTFQTPIRRRSGRVVQSLGLGGAPWRVLLSVIAPSGRRSPTITRPLASCP
jgi:hypothetical protein